MKTPVFYIFALIISLFLSPCLHAQDLKQLPQDPAIKKGILPCGITYYVAQNGLVKSKADFALIQKSVQEGFQNKMAGSQRFKTGSIQSFLQRNSVNYGSDGYLQRRPVASTYKFESVSVNDKMVDSTLLAIVDIIERSDNISYKDQAIVVSGDVNPDGIISKIKMMTYMLPPNAAPLYDVPYVWFQSDQAKIITSTEPLQDNVFSVSVEFSSPRLSKEHIATVLPVVTGRMCRELGVVLEDRIENNLHVAGVPYSSVKFAIEESGETNSDERFKVIIRTTEKHIRAACAIMVAAIVDVDDGRITLDEYIHAHNLIKKSDVDKSKAEVQTNARYIKRCRDNYLYGASLSTDAEKLAFLNNRNLSDSTNYNLFLTFAQGLIDKDKNVKLESSSDIHMTDVYYDVWDAHSTVNELKMKVDTAYSLAVLPKVGERVKAPSRRTEPMSKGRLWTFQNGVKVVYLKKPTGGQLYYRVSMNGGLSLLHEPTRGDAAFLEEMFFLCRVNGLDGKRLKHILRSRGIWMTPKITSNEFSLSGFLPNDSLSLFMGALLGFANDRVEDKDLTKFYVERQKVVLQDIENKTQERLMNIDSLLYPNGPYSQYKSYAALESTLEHKASHFFNDHFKKMNDGVIVMVSDMEEAKVLDVLQYYVGRLRKQPGISRMTLNPVRPISGANTYTIENEYNSVDVAMTYALQYTALNDVVVKLAALAIQNRFDKILMGTGMRAQVKTFFESAPVEIAGMAVMVDEVEKGSLLETEYKTPYEVFDIVRLALSDLAAKPISAGELNACKAELKTRYAVESASPEYWTKAISQRYCEGKDMVTKYTDYINTATSEQIKSLISSLYNSGKVEYINIKE
jgi:hypothetical protein